MAPFPPDRKLPGSVVLAASFRMVTLGESVPMLARLEGLGLLLSWMGREAGNMRKLFKIHLSMIEIGGSIGTERCCREPVPPWSLYPDHIAWEPEIPR